MWHLAGDKTAIAHDRLEYPIGDDPMTQVIRMAVVFVDDPINADFRGINIRQNEPIGLRQLFNDEVIDFRYIVIALFPRFAIVVEKFMHIVGIDKDDDRINLTPNAVDEFLVGTAEGLRRRPPWIAPELYWTLNKPYI